MKRSEVPQTAADHTHMYTYTFDGNSGCCCCVGGDGGGGDFAAVADERQVEENSKDFHARASHSPAALRIIMSVCVYLCM